MRLGPCDLTSLHHHHHCDKQCKESVVMGHSSHISSCISWRPHLRLQRRFADVGQPLGATSRSADITLWDKMTAASWTIRSCYLNEERPA
jgi:hypothetical protein